MSEVTRSVSCWVWLAWVVAETTRKSHLRSSCALSTVIKYKLLWCVWALQ